MMITWERGREEGRGQGGRKREREGGREKMRKREGERERGEDSNRIPMPTQSTHRPLPGQQPTCAAQWWH